MPPDRKLSQVQGYTDKYQLTRLELVIDRSTINITVCQITVFVFFPLYVFVRTLFHVNKAK